MIKIRIFFSGGSSRTMMSLVNAFKLRYAPNMPLASQLFQVTVLSKFVNFQDRWSGTKQPSSSSCISIDEVKIIMESRKSVAKR